ncbi:peptidase [Kitasatospora sp. NPDC097605]|uniref:peptidase n=1 Tax=Kitasatospora sp. NPDC097605 TaxID=3157226 RepID=UPI003332B2A5
MGRFSGLSGLSGLSTVSVAMVALAGAVAFTVPASASPVSGAGDQATSSAVGAAFWAGQNAVGAVADAITAEVRKLPDEGGYAGLVTDPEKSAITVHWKGAVPAAVRQAARGDRHVKVTFAEAPYTHRQLLDARDRAFAQRDQLPGKLTSVGPSPDGKGLILGVAEDGGNAVGSRQSEAVARDITDLTGGVAVVRVKSQNPQAATGTAVAAAGTSGRDTQQAYGGARWTYWEGSDRYVCSTGFAVRVPGSPWRLMTSAAHCGNQGTQAYSPQFPDSRAFGSVGHRDTERDINLLYPGASDFFQPRMWWGPWAEASNAGDQRTWPVKGLHQNYVGQRVCSSGSQSGNICDITIEATEQTVVYRDGTTVQRTVQVHKPNQAVWGSGDSGGPVSQPDGSDVYANGIISGGTNDAQCEGKPNRSCGTTGWYAPLDIYLEKQGLELVTG